MFQRDYILRMIESISRVMARFLMLKAQEQEQETLYQLEEFYGKLRLPQSRLLIKMTDDELTALVSVNGEPDLDKTVSLAYLLREEGRIYESMGQHGESSVRFNKSLPLFLLAARLGADVPGIDCKTAIEELRGLLRTYRIPGPALRSLFVFYEREGRYASAEDVLFELLESAPPANRPEDLAAGERFFEGLLEKDDEELEAGNLTRGEVEQGKLDMLRLFGAPPTPEIRQNGQEDGIN